MKRSLCLFLLVSLFQVSNVWAMSIYDAAELGNKDRVKQLLDQEVSIDSCDGWGTPLHYAIVGDQKEMVSFLIFKGAFVEHKDVYGRTPLHCAALRGNRKIVSILLTQGRALVNSVTRDHATPLDMVFLGAVETLIPVSISERKKVAQLLLDYRAEINSTYATPPLLTVMGMDRKRRYLLAWLIAHGADPECIYDNVSCLDRCTDSKLRKCMLKEREKYLKKHPYIFSMGE